MEHQSQMQQLAWQQPSLPPEEEPRISKCTQLIDAHHGVFKPQLWLGYCVLQNTVQAEKSAANPWKVGAAWPCSYSSGALEASKAMSLTHTRSCRDTVSRRRTSTLMATSYFRPRFLKSRCGL